ncbi:unnamed protein product [Linum tenue]|uniref:Uncharacterized protein n=1 Tax=Linum tenue TaxID=586396 RepID=A0AAV0GYD2_9ROSI|nr:unnamed protein product [Linum tenue]
MSAEPSEECRSEDVLREKHAQSAARN